MSIERSIRKHFKGDEDIMYEVITAFLETLPKCLEKLADAISRKTSEEIFAAAHLLKGSVSVFFMKDLDALLTELERMGKQSDLKESEILFSKIKSKLTILCIELDTISKKQKRVA